MFFTFYNFRFLLATTLCALLMSCGGDEASDESGGADSDKADDGSSQVDKETKQPEQAVTSGDEVVADEPEEKVIPNPNGVYLPTGEEKNGAETGQKKRC